MNVYFQKKKIKYKKNPKIHIFIEKKSIVELSSMNEKHAKRRREARVK